MAGQGDLPGCVHHNSNLPKGRNEAAGKANVDIYCISAYKTMTNGNPPNHRGPLLHKAEPDPQADYKENKAPQFWELKLLLRIRSENKILRICDAKLSHFLRNMIIGLREITGHITNHCWKT